MFELDTVQNENTKIFVDAFYAGDSDAEAERQKAEDAKREAKNAKEEKVKAELRSVCNGVDLDEDIHLFLLQADLDNALNNGTLTFNATKRGYVLQCAYGTEGKVLWKYEMGLSQFKRQPVACIHASLGSLLRQLRQNVKCMQEIEVRPISSGNSFVKLLEIIFTPEPSQKASGVFNVKHEEMLRSVSVTKNYPLDPLGRLNGWLLDKELPVALASVFIHE